jgi:hypothetical protein
VAHALRQTNMRFQVHTLRALRSKRNLNMLCITRWRTAYSRFSTIREHSCTFNYLYVYATERRFCFGKTNNEVFSRFAKTSASLSLGFRYTFSNPKLKLEVGIGNTIAMPTMFRVSSPTRQPELPTP